MHLTCPSTLNVGYEIVGCVFAIIIVKQLFGGLGQNFMNPALAARCFLLIAYTGPMTKFVHDGDEEIDIVRRRVESFEAVMDLPAEKPALEEIRRVVTIFRELRQGATEDGKTKLKTPSGTLSTAEAISVVNNGLAMSGYFGDGRLNATDLVSGIIGAVVKDPVQDQVIWQEYLETVVKGRDGWKDIYRASREML